MLKANVNVPPLVIGPTRDTIVHSASIEHQGKLCLTRMWRISIFALAGLGLLAGMAGFLLRQRD